MGWRDFVPDSAEDWVEDRAEDAGDLIEWGGDKVAGAADKVGLNETGDWVRDKSRSAANQLGSEVSELELGQTDDPNKLIYGGVSKIRAQVSHLNDFKSSFTTVGNGLKGLEGDGLKGASADAFRKAIAKEPRWFRAAEAFGQPPMPWAASRTPSTGPRARPRRLWRSTTGHRRSRRTHAPLFGDRARLIPVGPPTEIPK